MPSPRETALAAIFAALGGLGGPAVDRDVTDPLTIPAGGLIALNDGDGEVTKRGSRLAACVQHPELLVAVAGLDPAARAAAYDALLIRIDTLFQTDPSFGGRVREFEWSPPKAVALATASAAGLPIKAGLLTLGFTTVSTSPLQ